MAGEIVEAEIVTKDIAVSGRAGALAAASESDNPILRMMEIVTAKELTAESADVVKTMSEVAISWEDRNAKRAFFRAKAELRKDLPHVVATTPVKRKDGTVMYVYAKLDEMTDQIEDCLIAHGFDIGYDVNFTGEGLFYRCEVTLKLTYGGHTECNHSAARVSPASDMLTAAQMDMKARTTAKRGALADALNIVIESDNDARVEGAEITPNVAAELEAALKASGWFDVQVGGFWKTAGVEPGDFAHIRQGKVTALRQMLATIKPVAAAAAAKPAPQPASGTQPPTEAREPDETPAADQGQRDKAWGYIRACAKADKCKPEDVVGRLNKKMALAMTVPFGEWSETMIGEAMKRLMLRVEQDGIDVGLYLKGGPEFCAAPSK